MRKNERLIPYKFIFPAVSLLIVVFGVPIVNTIIYSFSDVTITQGIKNWVAFKNYGFLKDPEFLKTVWRTIKWSVFGVAGIFIYGMAVSLALNKPIPGRNFFRVMVIIPWLIPHAFSGTIWSWVLNSNSGFLNSLLLTLHLISEPISFFGEENAFATVVLIRIWKGAPFLIMTLMSAFQTIPTEVEEAAKIDGASNLRYFFNIMLPLLKPVLLSAGIILLAWTLTIFDLVYILTKGGPSHVTDIISITIYNQAFVNGSLGTAAAISTVVMIFISILGYLQMKAQEED